MLAAVAACVCAVAVVPAAGLMSEPFTAPSPGSEAGVPDRPTGDAQMVSSRPRTTEAPGSSTVPLPGPTDGDFTTSLPDERAAVAVATALAQRGLPYVWGGDGPAEGDGGFDCSGLTTFSYRVAGVALPRTAHTQYYAGPHVPAGAALQPGDLVFYGTAARVHHVGMYIGVGRMVNAPTFGEPVQVAYYRWSGDDYLGSTRPAAAGATFTAPLPRKPVDPAPTTRPDSGRPDRFDAPVAPLPDVLPRATDPQLPEPETATAARSAAGTSTGADPTSRSGGATASAPGASAASPSADTMRPGGAAAPTVRTPPPVPVPSSPGATAPSSTGVGLPTTPRSATTPGRAAPPRPPAPTTAAAAPPSTTTPVPAPSTTTPAPAPTRQITGLAFPAGTVRVSATRLGADGLPAGPGAAGSGRRTIVRLEPGGPATTLDTGAEITVSYSDGLTRLVTVRSVAPVGSDEAAAARAATAAGTVIVLAPTTDGSWLVIAAS